MARILRVQHWVPDFGYNDENFLALRGDSAEDLLVFAGQELPDPRRYDLVIVYGGYMSAYEDGKHPWIAKELRFLEDCVKSGTRILGICLGSQLLARLLGARVYKSPAPEFGFKQLMLNAAGLADPELGAIAGSEGRFLAIQWHEDAWDLPDGASLLASSDAWANQAFRYGPDMLAIQFHLEFTQPHMAWAVTRPEEGVCADPLAEDRSAFSAPSPRYGEIRTSMERLLGVMLDGAEKRVQPSGSVAASRAAR